MNIGRLNAFFEMYGEVSNIQMNRRTGYAYIQFSTNSEATKCVHSQKPVLGNKGILVSWSASSLKSLASAFDTGETNAGNDEFEDNAGGSGGGGGKMNGKKKVSDKVVHKVVDTMKLLQERKKIKMKQDALKLKLNLQKNILLNKQLNLYKLMLSKLKKDVSTTKKRFELIAIENFKINPHVIVELTDELQMEWALLDTHDNLTDHYKHFTTKERFTNSMKSLGLSEIECWKGGIGIEGRGRKPIDSKS